MTDPTLCQPLRLAEPITGGPFRRGGRFSPATWRKFSVQLASLIRYMQFWLFPYKMFFNDDGGMAERLANLLMVMFLCSHKINMRFLTAVIVSMRFTSLFCFILLIVAGLCRLRVLLYRLPVAYHLLILWKYTHITKKMEERLCIAEIAGLM